MTDLPNGQQLFSTGEDRAKSIITGSNGIISFDFKSVYPGHEAYTNPIYSLDFVGKNALVENSFAINQSARKHDIDPNLLGAIVYMENAHGWFDVLNPWPKTARPGNINAERWSELLGVPPSYISEFPDLNIELSAKLLAEIQKRLPGATPAAIATLYNNLRADMVSGYGLTAVQYMESLKQPGYPDGSAPPQPKLTFGPLGNDRDKAPLPGGTPSGTLLSFGPPPPAGGKTQPPAWAQPSVPLSMGTPVADRGPKPPQYPLGVPVSGGGSKPAAPVQPKLMANPPSSNLDRQDGPRESGSDRPDDPRFRSGVTGNGNTGGGGGTGSGKSSGGGSGGSGGGSGSSSGSKGPSFEYSGRSGSPAKTTSNSSNSSSAGGWGDMAKAGYGNSTTTSSGSSGGKTSGSSSSGKKSTAKPIILDLGGDGFDVSFTGTARFDMDGDGFRERVGWADAQDALLVLDLNANGTRGAGDGKIDQAKEVVLSLWGDAGMTDMEALAKARDANGQLMFDTNGDGKLTAADAAWGEFRVWQDADQDGVTDAGELKTLDQMGFTEIGLTYDDGTSYAETDDDVIIQGAALLGAATYVRSRWRLTASIDGIFFREFMPFGGVNRIELWSC